MKSVIKRLVARPLRFTARQILQRPWLKTRVRGLVMRMPRLHGMVMRVMFEAPVTVPNRIGTEQANLSLEARRKYRALKQAMHNRRR